MLLRVLGIFLAELLYRSRGAKILPRPGKQMQPLVHPFIVHRIRLNAPRHARAAKEFVDAHTEHIRHYR